MFNEKLSGVYSPDVEIELRKIAEYFENKNEECYIYKSRTMFGLTVPYVINFDDQTREADEFLFDCYMRYTKSLTDEESERFGCYITVGSKEYWSIDDDGYKGEPVWVK
jgi:hypothetical protein